MARLLAIGHGALSLEKALSFDRADGILPETLVPLAQNRGGDCYYWDTATNRIVLYVADDIEHPTEICTDPEAFFRLLNQAAK